MSEAIDWSCIQQPDFVSDSSHECIAQSKNSDKKKICADGSKHGGKNVCVSYGSGRTPKSAAALANANALASIKCKTYRDCAESSKTGLQNSGACDSAALQHLQSVRPDLETEIIAIKRACGQGGSNGSDVDTPCCMLMGYYDNLAQRDACKDGPQSKWTGYWKEFRRAVDCKFCTVNRPVMLHPSTETFACAMAEAVDANAEEIASNVCNYYSSEDSEVSPSEIESVKSAIGTLAQDIRYLCGSGGIRPGVTPGDGSDGTFTWRTFLIGTAVIVALAAIAAGIAVFYQHGSGKKSDKHTDAKKESSEMTTTTEAMSFLD